MNSREKKQREKEKEKEKGKDIGLRGKKVRKTGKRTGRLKTEEKKTARKRKEGGRSTRGISYRECWGGVGEWGKDEKMETVRTKTGMCKQRGSKRINSPQLGLIQNY